MAVFETFLEKLIRGEVDASEISTTLNRLINDDPTLAENLEKLIGQYNAAHPSAPAPQQIVDYLLNEITRISTITGGSVNQPAAEEDLEKTSILSAVDIDEGDIDLDATTMLDPNVVAADANVVDADATVANPDTDATVANPDADSTVVAPATASGSAALDVTSSSGTFVEATATSSDHMMINIGEEEDYDVDVGSLISGRYQIIEKLGEGGMGLVFKARDELMALAEDRNPYVAVKVLTKAFRQRRDAFIALQRETSKAQRLAHPNICTVFHFDKDGNTIYMTMELLNGVDLRDYINKHIKKPGKGYTMERAWPLIKGIADALSYAHKNNLIHSDLKPGNVYVVLDEKTGQETVKVIDFGIAQAIKPRDDSGELTGDVTKFDPKKLGALTPSYATVEMFNGMSPVQTDDIYALGCISYELLTGKRPYDRLTAKKAHMNQIKMPTVSLKNLGLTRRQERGLIRASRLLREDRTRTLEEFIHDVAPRKSYVWQIAAAVTGLVTLIGVLSIPSINAYFQDRYNAEVSARLNAPAADVFGAALEELLAYDDPLERTKVSNLNRVVIQDTISEICVSFFKPAEGRYDYQLALQLSSKGLGLFPDSNTLQGLRQTMLAELNLENSELGTVLAESLKTRALLPKGDSIGAVGVLVRAQTMDPANSLLRDPSLRFVFKEEAQKSIQSAKYDEAGQLIEFSSVYIADAATMPLYMGDKLTIARTAADRAKLLKQVQTAVARADQMTLSAQAEAGTGLSMALLRQLNPGDDTLKRAENNNDQRFNQSLQSVSASQQQATFEKFAPLLSATNLYKQKLRLLSVSGADATVFSAELVARYAQSQANFASSLERLNSLSLDPEKIATLDLLAREVTGVAAAEADLREFMQTYANYMASSVNGLIASNRYDLARVQLAQARAMLPADLTRALATADARIDKELAVFDRTERRAQALAQIESIRQNLVRQLDARNVTQAQLIEKELRGVMDPQDPFLTEELPVRYAEILYELSIGAVEAGKVSQAKGYFRDLSKYITKKDERYARVDSLLKGESLKARLLAQIKRARVVYEQDIRQKTNDLVRLNAWAVNDFFEVLVAAAITRAEELTSTKREQAQEIINVMRAVFPNSARLRNYELPDDGSPEPSAVDTGLSKESEAALASAGSEAAAGADPRLGQLVASVEDNLRKRQLTETYRILENARKEFPDEKRISDLDQAYRKERSKAENAYRKHNSAVLRGDFNAATKLIQAAIGFWKDNDEFKQAERNISSIRAQVKAGARVCSDNLSGKGRNPRAVCYDIFKGKKGPRLIIIPGDKGLLSSFVMTRHEITIGDYNLYCKSSRKCKAIRGKSKHPVTGLAVTEMEAYAKWLSTNSLYTYRLPTLREWMYATTANNKEENNDYNCTLLISGHQVKGHEIQPADTGAPNRWGLINYVGNVDEVVVSDGKYVLKGGNHKDPMFQCNTDIVKKDFGGKGQALTGFRLIRTLH